MQTKSKVVHNYENEIINNEIFFDDLIKHVLFFVYE